VATCPQAGAAYVSVDLISGLSIIRAKSLLIGEDFLRMPQSVVCCTH
jgi:hypothetical protein